MNDRERRRLKFWIVFVNCSLSVYTAALVTGIIILVARGQCP